jgi:CubicO group peptidase (beta-lactamase class C family)
MLQRRQLLLGLSGLALAPALPARAAVPVDAAALLKATPAPAVAGAVVGPKGVEDIVFAGVRRIGAPDPVGRDDLWHLGSNTKAMTAALYGRLVEQGAARWGATLTELFPQVAVDPAFAPVTVEQLLGHRSGIVDAPIIQGGWLLRAHQDKRPLPVQRAELAGQILAAPPAGQPGAFAYSNMGYILAGSAIERITGQGWEEAMTSRLFKPLGVTAAGFGPPTGANPWGHRPGGGGLVGVDPSGFADNPPALGPAGRIHMTLTDYGRFLRLFLGGEGLLKPATVSRLTTPVPGEGRPYALGWAVSAPAWSPGPLIAHEGSNTMWHAVSFVSPGLKRAFVGVCNGPPDASGQSARKMADALRVQVAPDAKDAA